MGLGSRIAREVRYTRALLRALSRVKDVSADSANLIADDWERAADRWADNTALSRTSSRPWSHSWSGSAGPCCLG